MSIKLLSIWKHTIRTEKWIELRCQAAGGIQPYLFGSQTHEACQSMQDSY